MPVLDFSNLQDDITEGDRIVQLWMKVTGMTSEELRLSEAMSAALESRAWSIAQGRTCSYDEMYEEINAIAEDHGFEHGVPFPTVSKEHGIGDVVTARRAPLHGLMSARFWRTEMEERLAEEQISVRNSWSRLGDTQVSLIDTDQGPVAISEGHSGWRLQKWMRTLSARMDSALTVEAEVRAMASLKQKIGESQWRCYLLNNCFPEQSRRSGLHYFFRKGLPTLVISYNGNNQGKVITTLCLHPFGYHKGTFAGVMTPTDEVIAALTLMRGDEHTLWKKSGQWPAWDLRSGI